MRRPLSNNVLDDIIDRTTGVAGNFLTADIDLEHRGGGRPRARLSTSSGMTRTRRSSRRAHRARGVGVSWQVGSVRGSMRRGQDAGVDVVIAQGSDAGGHVRGTSGLLTLLPGVLTKSTCPSWRLAASDIHGHSRPFWPPARPEPGWARRSSPLTSRALIRCTSRRSSTPDGATPPSLTCSRPLSAVCHLDATSCPGGLHRHGAVATRGGGRRITYGSRTLPLRRHHRCHPAPRRPATSKRWRCTPATRPPTSPPSAPQQTPVMALRRRRGHARSN